MIRSVFAVKDAKAEIFSPPMLSVNTGTMLRSLLDALGDPGHQYSRHPEDFVLYELGTFDDSNGVFDLLDAPASLMLLSDLDTE